MSEGTQARPTPNAALPAVRRTSSRVLAALSGLGAIGLAVYLAQRSYEVDIDVYLTGGQHALNADLYTVQFGRPYLQFTYPPFAAMLFWPLAHALGIFRAQTLWAVVNVVALYGVLLVALRAAHAGLGRTTTRTYALIALFPATLLNPVFLTVGLGQVNLVLCLAVLWDLSGSESACIPRIPRGLATGVAAAIKLTPLIFVPYLLLTGQRRAARNATVAFLACTGLAYALAPRTSRSFWTHYIFDSRRAGALLYSSDQNLVSALSRFVHVQLSSSNLWPLLVVIAVAGVGLAVLAHRYTSPQLGLLLCAATGLLVSPITWTHHLVWVVPVIVWLALDQQRPRHGRYWAAGVALLFWSAPIWWVPTSWRPSNTPVELKEHGWRLVAGNSFCIAMVGFVLWGAVFVLRRAHAPETGQRQYAAAT